MSKFRNRAGSDSDRVLKVIPEMDLYTFTVLLIVEIFPNMVFTILLLHVIKKKDATFLIFGVESVN